MFNRYGRSLESQSFVTVRHNKRNLRVFLFVFFYMVTVGLFIAAIMQVGSFKVTITG